MSCHHLASPATNSTAAVPNGEVATMDAVAVVSLRICKFPSCVSLNFCDPERSARKNVSTSSSPEDDALPNRQVSTELFRNANEETCEMRR